MNITCSLWFIHLCLHASPFCQWQRQSSSQLHHQGNHSWCVPQHLNHPLFQDLILFTFVIRAVITQPHILNAPSIIPTVFFNFNCHLASFILALSLHILGNSPSTIIGSLLSFSQGHGAMGASTVAFRSGIIPFLVVHLEQASFPVV